MKRAKAEVKSRRRSGGRSAQSAQGARRRGRRVRRRPRHPSRPRSVRGGGRHQARPDRHYLSVPDLILPHVANRPLAWCAVRMASAANAFSRSTPQRVSRRVRSIRSRKSRHARIYLYRRRARVGRAGPGRRARTARLGLPSMTWRSPTGWCSTSIRTRGSFRACRDGGERYAWAAEDTWSRKFCDGDRRQGRACGGALEPRHSWDEHRDFAEAMARVMAEEDPDRFVANMSKAKRKGKISSTTCATGAARPRSRPFPRGRAPAPCGDAGVVAAAGEDEGCASGEHQGRQEAAQGRSLAGLRAGETGAAARQAQVERRKSKGPARGRPFVMSDVASISSTTA